MIKNVGKKFLSDLKLHSDYLRWRDNVNRYETWEEAIDVVLIEPSFAQQIMTVD